MNIVAGKTYADETGARLTVIEIAGEMVHYQGASCMPRTMPLDVFEAWATAEYAPEEAP